MEKGIYLLLITVLVSACSSSGSQNARLSGAGATFPAPFYSVVFKQYAESNNGDNVTYGAVGSGGGVRSLKDQTVDFGATDVFMKDKDLAKMGADVVHIPTVLGAIVMAYNLPGIKDLKFTPDIIADIYRGKIKRWNDPKIKSLNPSLQLPDYEIVPVFRSDGSGTTAAFSEYLSKVNKDWKTEIGFGKSLNFPAGIAAKGNPGVAGIIAETKGAVGYIGSEYALALEMPSALLQNSSGNFIEANYNSISAAADTDMPDDMRVVITDSANPEAYPISTFTWIIVYKEQAYNNRSEATAQSLVRLLKYIVSSKGQDLAIKTYYAPLSDKAIEKTKAIIESITYNGKAIVVE